MKQKKKLNPVTAKKPVAAPVASAVANEEYTKKDTIMACAFSVLLFLAMTVQSGRMSVILAFLAVVSVVGVEPFRRMKERVTVPVLGLLMFMLMAGLAAIYSAFDAYALREYNKYIAGFSMTAILLLRFDRKHIKGLLWGFAAISAVISLVCIDMACHGGIFSIFNSFVEMFGGSFSRVSQGEFMSRINGIYNDANVSASIFAVGTLISWYLMRGGPQRWQRLVASVLLGISAQGFFLSMSRGAFLCFGVALVVWLIAAEKEGKVSLFFLMLFSVVVTFGLSMLAMPAIGTASPLPDLLAVVSGLVIFLLYEVVVLPLAKKLEGYGKRLLIVAGVFVIACVVYLVAAVNVTGTYTFDETGRVDRAMDLAAGTYTLEGEWDGEITVRVYSQTELQTATGEVTELYRGALDAANFTVSSDERVRIRFWAEEGDVIHTLRASDGTEIPMNYPLLPPFMVDRLQEGLLSGNSFLTRVQFMKDAWTLFLQSPLVGHGLGSTEGLYTSVQPFFYESLFVHNHILQVMSDMGLLGTISFLAVLLGGLWLLVRGLKQERDPQAAVLLACWVMINTHGLMEINFSVRAYLCYALAILLLPVLLYGKPLFSEKAVKLCGPVVAGACALYFAVFGGLLLSHRMVEREMSSYSATNVSEYMEQLKSCVRRDVFVQENYKLNFVANAVALQNPIYEQDLQKYRKDLQKGGTYTACTGLARYYYLPREEWDGLFACSRTGIAQEASNADAWNMQIDFYRIEVFPAAGAENMDVFLTGVGQLSEYLEKHNQSRLEKIVLTNENQAFLEKAVALREENRSDMGAYAELMSYAQGLPEEQAENAG